MDARDTIIPTEFPGLMRLAWNRDPTQPMKAAEAFALYEREWRHVVQDGLGEPEKLLLAELTERFGYGSFLG